MKVELHCHTNRYSLCGLASPAEMLGRLVETGYEAVFITEHNQVWSNGEIEEIQSRYPQLKIFPGVELTFDNPAGFSHLLVLGSNDPDVLALASPADVLAWAAERNLPTVLAHPFRFNGADWPIRSAEVLPDAFEYFSPNVDADQAKLALRAARRLDVRLVNAGDAHGLDYINQFWIETNRPFETPSELRKIIVEGDYENCGTGR